MGTQLPLPRRGQSPLIFGPCLLWPNGWMDQDATWYLGGRLWPRPHCARWPQPRWHCAQWGPSSRSPEKGAQPPPPQFSVHVCCSQTAGWISIPLGTEVGLGSDHIVLDEDPAPPKGAQPPIFGPCLLWPKGRPSQLLLSTCYVFCIIVPFSLLVHVWFCCIRFSFVSTVLSD